MNAPLFFFLSPIILAIPVLAFFSTRFRLVILGTSLFCLCMAITSLFLPLDQPLNLLGYSVPVSHTTSVFDRDFAFLPQMRDVLFLLFFSAAGFILFTFLFPPDLFLLPSILVSLSLFSAAVFVQPILFAIFFLFFTISFFAVWLFFSSRGAYQPAVRLIVFSLLGCLLLLLSIPLLSPDPNSIAFANTLQNGILLFGIGSLIMLSVPPMHFWQLDAVDRAPSYAYFFFSTIVSLFTFFLLFRFLNEYEALRNSVILFQGIQVLGISLCILGAVFSLLQEKGARIAIYLSFINFGSILLAFSIRSIEGFSIVCILLVCRIFLFLLCGISIQLISNATTMQSTKNIQGLFFRMPLTSLCLCISLLGMVGFPGLISFPGIWATLRLLSLQSDNARIAEVIVLLSIVVGTISAFQYSSNFFVSNKESIIGQTENRIVQLVLIFFIVSFFVGSIFPQLYLPSIAAASQRILNF
jgi:formate hydrogenlyase subunit 3/multisubunit Na+/H+ antiporter MnhD subunit